MSSACTSRGASLDDYLKAAGTTREALRDHAREQARHGVQVELALSEVARRENIHITDEELEQEYAQLSKEYQVPMERLREGLPPSGSRTTCGSPAPAR